LLIDREIKARGRAAHSITDLDLDLDLDLDREATIPRSVIQVGVFR